MSVIESNVLLQRKDENANSYILKPITDVNNVDGLEDLILSKIHSTAITTTTPDGGTDGANYAATVPGITALTAGVNFMMIPHVNSKASGYTLNVNNLGAKTIRRRISYNNTTTVNLSFIVTQLYANKPIHMTYDGTYWIVDDITQPMGNDLYGVVPVKLGGTGVSSLDDFKLPKRVTFQLTAASWDSTAKTQTATVSGVSATEEDQLIQIMPASASQTAYYDAEIMCTGQAANSLTFTASTVPTSDLTVYAIIQGVRT